MPKKEIEFDLGAMLEANSMKVSRMGDKGQIIVSTPDGDEQELDVNRMLVANKVNPSKVDIKYNSPTNAIPFSPLTIGERAVMDFGSQEKGNVNYLRKKFDDVNVDEKLGIVVKKNGVWMQADPNFFGNSDPWEVTKQLAFGGPAREELKGDLAELSQEAIDVAGSVAGGAAGAALGFTAGGLAGLATGSLPGAVAGSFVGAGVGGAAGSAMGGGAAAGGRMLLGRYMGTFEATDEELLRDTMWETVLGLGGEVVGAGVKVGTDMTKRALKNIAENTDQVGKQFVSGLYKFSLGLRQYSADKLATDPDAMISGASHLENILKARKVDVNPTNLNELTKNIQVETVEKSFGGFKRQVYGKFEKMQEDLLSDPNIKNFKVNVGQEIKGFLSKLESTGLLSPDADGNLVIKDQEKLAAALMGTNDLPTALRKKSIEKLEGFIDMAKTYSKLPEAGGRNAAEAAIKIRRSFRSAYNELTEKGTQTAKEVQSILRTPFNELTVALNNGFNSNESLKNKFSSMNKYYSENIDIADQAYKIAQDPKKIDAFINKLWSSNVAEENMLRHIQKQSSPITAKYMERIFDLEAAKDFVMNVPQPRNLQSGAGLLATSLVAGAGVMSGAVSGPVGLGVVGALTIPKAASRSAKMALNTPKYGAQVAKSMLAPAEAVKNFVLKLTPSQRRAAASDAAILGQMFGQILTAPEDQETIKTNVLNQALTK